MFHTLLSLAALSAAPPLPVGPVKLVGIDGKRHAVPAPRARATVVVFLSADCPMSNAYVPHLNAVASKYGPRGVRLFGVNSSPEEKLAALEAHAREYKIGFPVLKDDARKLAGAVGARVYPEAVVLDARGKVRYRGRIDDAYSARLKPRNKVTRHDLDAAIAQVLAGKAVSLPRTTAFGCPIPGVEKRAVAKSPTVTYHRDVLPVLQSACQSCHRPGQVGPFSLMTYAEAARWADDIVGETRAGRMPPWKPTQRGVFTNERTLTAAQKKVLEQWVKEGMPEGDPKHAPKPAKFPEGWQLGKPDLVLEMPSEAVIGPKGRDAFHCVVFRTNFKKDMYIAAVEVQPGNTRVVHHTVQIIDTSGTGRALLKRGFLRPREGDSGPGYWTRIGFGYLPDPAKGLGGWAPGLVPQMLPPGVGLKLPKGADVIMQVHYHRTGKEERDRTKIGLYFQKGPVTGNFQAIGVPGLFFRIPAGEKNCKVETSWRLAEDVTLHYLIPHMHLLGKSIELTAKVPGGKEEVLISIPEWDYNWQEMYQLKTPRKLPRGTVLRVRAVYDNSSENPRNPSDPPRTARFGEQTTHEMCFVFCGVHSKSPSFMKLGLNVLGK